MRRRKEAACPLQDVKVNYITELSLRNVKKVKNTKKLNDLKTFYSPSGPMSSLPGYEFRPQQLEVALALQNFLRDPEQISFAVEAPTGVGKTFAVLVPALMEGLRRGARLLFLTAGIALQEQLIEKDLPRLRQLLGINFNFGLLKGRANYVCLRLARNVIATPSLFREDGDDGEVSIAEWLEETETGDLAELNLPQNSPFLHGVTAGSRSCISTSCPCRERCFVIRAYRNAQDWDITVANYNLYFSHILEGGGAFPVRYDWLICDEAHRLPDAARSAATVRVSFESESWLFGPRAQGFASFLKTHFPGAPDLSAHTEQLRTDLRELMEETLPLHISESGELHAQDEDLLRRGNALAGNLDSMLRSLRGIEERFASGDFTDRAAVTQGAELINWMDDIREFRRSLLWCLSVDQFPKWAYWAESRSSSSYGKGPVGALLSKPVDSSEIVQDVLEKEGPEKIILTSATMTLSGAFDFWSRESGITLNGSLIVDSPFDFQNQMEVLVLDVGLKVGEKGYDDRMCRVMERLCDDNGGRTLVLLSSLRLMRTFARRMREGDRPYTVLVQGDMPQRQILRQFVEDERSILIGSVSFREGVDVPGEGLTQVIIDRIPFPHPNDPLVRARDELEGGKSFVTVTLPTVKMILRQAVGRLIRSSSDHGRVALLDGRAVDKKSWGILSCLPPCRCKRLSVNEEEL